MKVGEFYPCGPCPFDDFKIECHCGETLTPDTVVNHTCEELCDICEHVDDKKCPSCGAHAHCGGCV